MPFSTSSGNAPISEAITGLARANDSRTVRPNVSPHSDGTIVNREFGRKYLFKDASKISSVILGGDRQPVDIDKIDLNILSQLAENARKNSVAISRSINLTPKSVIHRIKKLQKRNILFQFHLMRVLMVTRRGITK